MVVEVHDHRRQQEPLFAALDRTTARRAFETVEKRGQVSCRTLPTHVRGEPVHPFVRRTERARCAAADEVVAEGLLRSSGGASADGGRELLGAMSVCHGNTLFLILVVNGRQRSAP